MKASETKSFTYKPNGLTVGEVGASTKIKDGDFIVIVGRWDVYIQQAIKITPQLVFYRDASWRDRERRVRIDEVAFAGPEQIARRLTEQLQSSAAQLDADKSADYDRKKKRDQAFIACAIAAVGDRTASATRTAES